MPFIETDAVVGDIKIKVLKAGSGDPVLFLHGSNGITPGAAMFLEGLADTNTVIAPIHPGFFGSDNPDLIRSVPDMALFYLEFMESQNLKNVQLVGSSLGGWIAAEIAIRDCSHIKTLTLLSPAGIRVPGISLGDIFMWSPEETTRNSFHDPAMVTALLMTSLTEEQVDIQLHNRFAAVKLQWEPRGFNPDLEKWLHRIRRPAHIIWGQHDKIVPYAYAEAWQRALPDNSLTTISDAGHLPHIERADLTRTHMREFWQRAS